MGAAGGQGHKSAARERWLSMSGSPGDLLTRLCPNALSVFIAAPYIKAGALARVLANVNPEASLTCVTRWTPHDLAVGASDAKCRTLVKQFGGSFRLHPSLHAKFYRIDEAVLIGSANLTSSAMGWAPQSNLEILCRAGDDFNACAFQRELLTGTREINDDEFLRWEAIVKINARNDNVITSGQPDLDAWRPVTREPRHLEISYQGRGEEIASYDEQRAALRDIQTLLIPPGLSGDEVRMWASACLLAAPFINTVIQLRNAANIQDSCRGLADTYGLGLTEARREVETIQSWLAFFVPETLRGFS